MLDASGEPKLKVTRCADASAGRCRAGTSVVGGQGEDRENRLNRPSS